MTGENGGNYPDPFTNPVTAADAYRQRLGWPAWRIAQVVWMPPGVVAEALNMPRDLGQRVLAHLDIAGMDLPVIDIPGPPARYALLTRPHPGPPGEILILFEGLDVGYAHGGYHEGRRSEWGIDLPPTRHPGSDPLTWLRPPDTPLPPLAVVVRAVLTVVDRR